MCGVLITLPPCRTLCPAFRLYSPARSQRRIDACQHIGRQLQWREITRVPRLMLLKYVFAARRTVASPCLALEATRAMFTMRRGLIPYSQAEMHLPLLVQTCAHRSASGVLAPPASRPNTPPAIEVAFALSRPAGSTIGQASTHFLQRVQASRDVIDPCNRMASVNDNSPLSGMTRRWSLSGRASAAPAATGTGDVRGLTPRLHQRDAVPFRPLPGAAAPGPIRLGLHQSRWRWGSVWRLVLVVQRIQHLSGLPGGQNAPSERGAATERRERAARGPPTGNSAWLLIQLARGEAANTITSWATSSAVPSSPHGETVPCVVVVERRVGDDDTASQHVVLERGSNPARRY